jgi:hypothetical protein
LDIVSRSYSQGPTESYSSPPSSHLYSQQATINSTAAYPGRHGAYDSPQRSNLPSYGVSPRTNEAHHPAGMESLSRQSSRYDTYEQYPASDHSAGGFPYASSGGSQPIAITQRRPSTLSARSDDSFDSTYGFRSSVTSPGPIDCKFEKITEPLKLLTDGTSPWESSQWPPKFGQLLSSKVDKICRPNQ